MPKYQSSFFHQDFISVDQISHKQQIMELFTHADRMKKYVEHHKIHESLKGKSIAILFYQPSTRTFSSFVAAATRLGAYVTAIHGMSEVSSAVKGESLEDTIQTICRTTAADAIVLRHPGDDSNQIAAETAPIPIINGGSGKAEHPTQSLLDLYTIYQSYKKFDGLHVAMVGDILYGRTPKSLAKLLAVMSSNIKITFVSPSRLKAPQSFLQTLKGRVQVGETENFKEVLPQVDVLYMTRIQKEWFEQAGKMTEYEKVKNRLILIPELVSLMKKKAIIMHPLPRVNEIDHKVDTDPRVRYFDQMRAGLYIRMALLEKILLRGRLQKNK